MVKRLQCWEQLMTYFKKQSETSSAELLTLRRLRHHTAKIRQSSLKQKNIMEYFNRVQKLNSFNFLYGCIGIIHMYMFNVK